MKLVKAILFSAAAVTLSLGCHAQSGKEAPKVVTPGDWDTMIAPPSDAIVLFDGRNLDKWQSDGGGPAPWEVKDGIMISKARTGNIRTKQSFGDAQIHVEWLQPESKAEGQGRGNSGVFMQGIYEVQVLDSYEHSTYYDGQAGAIYSQYPPLINAMQKPGKWNVYDIIYKAPRFTENGTLASPAVMTVFHNGVLIQNNSIILGKTMPGEGRSYEAHGDGPLLLQDHGNPVHFRNIWIREL